MVRLVCIASCVLLLLACGPVASHSDFDPHVLVYTGRIPGYGEALAEIINETGAKAVVVDSDAVMRGLLPLPQTRCVVIAALNPSDFVFLRDFAPAFLTYFGEGGSYVGLGPCCSLELEDFASTIFPIRGNGSVRGKKRGDDYGSVYILSEALPGITDALPDSFLITQEKATYASGADGPLEPATDLGSLQVLYREQDTGIPLVVTLETEAGGRTVSLPGCHVVGVERLPFYWGKLVAQAEFRELLRRSVEWAMAGNGRFDRLVPSLEEDLHDERERLDALAEAGADQRSRETQGRIFLLMAVWAAALVFQGFLVVRFIIPRFRSPA